MQVTKYSTTHAITLLVGRRFSVSRMNSHISETTNRRAGATIWTDLGLFESPTIPYFGGETY